MPPSVKMSTNQTIVEGSRVVIMCNVSGSEPMDITWKRKGSSAILAKGQHLVLDNVNKTNIGGYQCTASNECGTTTVISHIYVICKYNMSHCQWHTC